VSILFFANGEIPFFTKHAIANCTSRFPYRTTPSLSPFSHLAGSYLRFQTHTNHFFTPLAVFRLHPLGEAGRPFFCPWMGLTLSLGAVQGADKVNHPFFPTSGGF